MRKYTQRAIKDYTRNGAAEDISGYSFDEMKDFLHSHNLEKIGYSCGVYGINGGLLQNNETGKLYAIIKRTSALLMAF